MPLKVSLATPAYRRQVDVEHVWQGISLCLACIDDIHLLGYSYADSYCLDWSRNHLLHQALEAGADWLLTVDADTYHTDPEDTLRMIRAGQEREAALISAPVLLRGRRAKYNAFDIRDDQLHYPIAKERFEGKVVEVNAVGAAYLAINLGWFRARWPEQPWFLSTPLPGPQPRVRSEDLTFCAGVRHRGGVILVDGRFEPRHVGTAD
jgi:hypothetical protein